MLMGAVHSKSLLEKLLDKQSQHPMRPDEGCTVKQEEINLYTIPLWKPAMLIQPSIVQPTTRLPNFMMSPLAQCRSLLA